MNQQVRARLEEISEELQQLMFDEEEKYDNLPEGIQDSERGEMFQEAIESLSSAIDALNEIILRGAD